MSVTVQPEAEARFSTVEEMEQWVASATDGEIVAMYADSIVLSPQQAEYGRELIQAAKARLEGSEHLREARAEVAAAD